jgi:hypothetical protein
MLLITALLAAASPTAVTVIPVKHSPGAITPICRNPEPRAAAGDTKAGIHPLGAEPPARHLYAVAREIDGCDKPVVIAERVGAPKP